LIVNCEDFGLLVVIKDHGCSTEDEGGSREGKEELGIEGECAQIHQNG